MRRKIKVEHRKKDEDKDASGQLITIQFGTLSPVMASNYLLANEFKNKESNEVMMEETTEVTCVLECEEGTSNRDQVIHDNSEEEDDGMTDVEEKIDVEAERRIRRVSHNNLLRQLYQEGNPIVGFLGEPSRRSFDYYVLYGMPTRKKKVPRDEKYGSPPDIVPPPMGWEELLGDFIQLEEAKEISSQEILLVNISNKDEAEKDKEKVEINAKKRVIFKKPLVKLTKNLRPLYVKALVNGIPVAKVLIDNGAAINTIPYRMIRKFIKPGSNMIPTGVILTSFNGRATSAKGVMPLDIKNGE
ncbi:Uncharacterized protein Adt_23493 [Abeliophyllum distichum]|uniref:Uncharacterized protein n=1 Tax=Abeliophyllum distichum TaxID=126358 RepID=A0ABD1SB13_9LAMI